MIKQDRYKIEVDRESEYVRVPTEGKCLCGFREKYPKYKKYFENSSLVYRKCTASPTNLWKLLSGLVYDITGKSSNPTRIKRTAKDMLHHEHIYITGEIHRLFLTDYPMHYYALNDYGVSVYMMLRGQSWPAEKIEAANKRQEKLFQKAKRDAVQIELDFAKWETEIALERLE